MSDSKITRLPVNGRRDSIGRVLEVVHTHACRHTRFVVDQQLEQVTCRDCGERLNPMFALIQLANKETEYHALHARYHDELQRLGARQKTKCQHCGQMTRISKA